MASSSSRDINPNDYSRYQHPRIEDNTGGSQDHARRVQTTHVSQYIEPRSNDRRMCVMEININVALGGDGGGTSSRSIYSSQKSPPTRQNVTIREDRNRDSYTLREDRNRDPYTLREDRNRDPYTSSTMRTSPTNRSTIAFDDVGYVDMDVRYPRRSVVIATDGTVNTRSISPPSSLSQQSAGFQSKATNRGREDY